jgi:peptidoglycan/LPS O-acetylase OafA/YrhL
MSRISFLDAVRAVLAWSVVVIHVGYFNGFPVGNIGPYVVGTFIVLSGFVITKLLTEKHEPYSVFVLRRGLRLFPTYLVCVAVAIALRPWTIGTFEPESLREVHEHAAYNWHLLAHVTLLHGLVPEFLLPDASYTFLPPAWSLSVEWQLYLIAPLVVWLLQRSAPKVPLMVACASFLVVLVTPIHWRLQHYWDHMGGFFVQKFYLFMLGALLYHYWPSVIPQWQAPRWLLWLGKISYSTYLIHFPLLMLLNAHLGWRGEPWLRASIMFTCSAPFIVAVSALLYERVEKSGIALGKALIKERETSSGSSFPLVSAGAERGYAKQ